MKKLIAISAIALALTTCATQASGAELKTSAVVTNKSDVAFSASWFAAQKEEQNRLDAIAAHKAEVASNTEQLNTVISQLKGRVGKTWYVFSGATPSGWDCSGMTMWAYEQLGVNLEHRASKQKEAGTKVKSPKLGDIVAFTYDGTQSAYHVGIYLSPDKMIHAGGGRGEATSIASISKFAGNNSYVTYTRFIETN